MSVFERNCNFVVATDVSLNCPFRKSICQFVKNSAERLDNARMPTWCCKLGDIYGNVVPLYIIEITPQQPQQAIGQYCNHCSSAGLGNRFVSIKKYHIILPGSSADEKSLNNGSFDVDIFESQNHILHGLIHSNGSGHLICINGIEGASGIEGCSKFYSGKEIMELWDCLCIHLRAREITVRDLSTRQLMDLRLLYGVAYEDTFFGKWDFQFLQGSFGVSKEKYYNDLAALCMYQVDDVIANFGREANGVQILDLLKKYRRLSPKRLVTLQDLFAFMLLRKSGGCGRNSIWNGDVYFLYTSVLLKINFSRTILDCKSFYKAYSLVESPELTLVCQLTSNSNIEESALEIGVPNEVYVLPQDTKVSELKTLIEENLRKTYYCMNEFKVTDVERAVDLERLAPSESVSEKVNWGGLLIVKGNGVDLNNAFKKEGGPAVWVVWCKKCKACEDDGEQMVECQNCQVWCHTSCYNFDLAADFRCLNCSVAHG